MFKNETGWGRYWFDKYWPIGGYASACEEADVKRGAIFGVETNIRVTEEELAIKFAEVVQKLGGKTPSKNRFNAVARMNPTTLMRGDSWADAKRRVISVYFGLPAGRRCGTMIRARPAHLVPRLFGSDEAGEFQHLGSADGRTNRLKIETGHWHLTSLQLTTSSHAAEKRNP